MKFSIRVVDEAPHAPFGEECVWGAVTIGDFTERIAMPVGFWSVARYDRQWREALDAILGGAERACLVTEMRDPRTSVFISLFPMYRESGMVYIRNQIVFCDERAEAILAEDFNSLINDRHPDSDGQPISEWPLPLSDLQEAARGMT